MCIYRCFCMHVDTLCVFGLMITRRRFSIPWNRSYRQCYLPCGTRKLNPGPLEKEPVFLIAKTCLQSRFLGLNWKQFLKIIWHKKVEFNSYFYIHIDLPTLDLTNAGAVQTYHTRKKEKRKHRYIKFDLKGLQVHPGNHTMASGSQLPHRAFSELLSILLLWNPCHTLPKMGPENAKIIYHCLHYLPL